METENIGNKNMNKRDKYKFVFEYAKKFLEEIVSRHPNLDTSDIEKHLNLRPKFNNISDANLRLIESLSNRDMMASVIGFNEREKEMRAILFEYNPNKILATYKNANELLDKFRNKFNLQNASGKRSLWRKFSEGIIRLTGPLPSLR